MKNPSDEKKIGTENPVPITAKEEGLSVQEKFEPDISGGLNELFEDQLKQIYWAENELTKTLQQMISKATSLELHSALSEHLEITRQQIIRLDELFSKLKMKAEGEKCEALAGLILEREKTINRIEEGDLCDAGIIAAARKLEHYEMASYSILISFAKALKLKDSLRLLNKSLQEEKECDEELSNLSLEINIEATSSS
ncbi:DUF892 family protein [Marivirga sp. S37H4]|uniref:DUF892 family protein n=1 Tax=Marivirga aurantiaca TaxID=2802615 RepID=A0A934WW55_9BACT|nr:DUF892 family protein [Marivirga aurantiaca]MBK6264062.1 DUF892 family protein [Marivirga aurantiaca]